MKYRFKSKDVSADKNVNWKGDNAGYVAKHIWIKYHFGKASKCECCRKTKKKITWANISGKFLRNRKDWKQLCISCHRKFDYKRGSYHSKGEDYKTAKLTEKQVKSIKKEYIPHKITYHFLGKKYKVDHTTIWHIIKGRNWKHLLLNKK